jgi:hypothetical protein
MFRHSREKRGSRAGHSSSVALDSRFLSCQEILQTGQFVIPAKEAVIQLVSTSRITILM